MPPNKFEKGRKMSQSLIVLAAMALVAGQEEVEVVNKEKECLEDFCLEPGYRSWRFAKQENR